MAVSGDNGRSPMGDDGTDQSASERVARAVRTAGLLRRGGTRTILRSEPTVRHQQPHRDWSAAPEMIEPAIARPIS